MSAKEEIAAKNAIHPETANPNVLSIADRLIKEKTVIVMQNRATSTNQGDIAMRTFSIPRLATFFVALSLAFLSLSAAEPRRGGETPNQWPPLAENKTFQSAAVDTEGDVLKISTGVMERRWKLTDRGPVTIGLKNLKTEYEWVREVPETGCDFAPAGFSGNLVCTALNVKQDNDQGFTDDHLAVTVEFQDPETKAEFRWVIWAYPNAIGLRTRLSVRRMPKLDEVSSFENEGVVDSLPVNMAKKKLYAWTPGKRPYQSGPNTRQAIGEIVEHAALEIRDGNETLIMIKESVKGESGEPADFCSYANTGRFAWNSKAIRNTGTGWLPEEMTSDDWKPCWAAWTLATAGSHDDVSLAVMQFDRKRFPLKAERDLDIRINTWDIVEEPPKGAGPGHDIRPNILQARQEWVMKEIDGAANLGIDMVMIDAGWAGNDSAKWNTSGWRPEKTMKLHEGDAIFSQYPDGIAPNYPNGWTDVRDYAKKKGVKLGLWFAAQAKAEDIIRNVREADLRTVKYDFYNSSTMERAQRDMEKMREVLLAVGHPLNIEWDCTTGGRIGRYHGREYGMLYPQNLYMRYPHPSYHPNMPLNYGRNMADTRFNIQHLILAVGSPELAFNAEAKNYPQDYCFAVTINTAPMLFFGTQYVKNQEHLDALREIIGVYKQHRVALLNGYVFPLEKGVVGYQNYNPETKVNYLTVFRPLRDQQAAKNISLRFAKPGAKLKVTDLRTGNETLTTLNEDGAFPWEIAQCPGFAFLKCEFIE